MVVYKVTDLPSWYLATTTATKTMTEIEGDIVRKETMYYAAPPYNSLVMYTLIVRNGMEEVKSDIYHYARLKTRKDALDLQSLTTPQEIRNAFFTFKIKEVSMEEMLRELNFDIEKIKEYVKTVKKTTGLRF